jgi:hypothetical protein
MVLSPFGSYEAVKDDRLKGLAVIRHRASFFPEDVYLFPHIIMMPPATPTSKYRHARRTQPSLARSLLVLCAEKPRLAAEGYIKTS